MGSLYSTPMPVPNQKPASVMPLVGRGEYETGCADIMVDAVQASEEEPEEARGVFARIFYPTRMKEDGKSGEGSVDSTSASDMTDSTLSVEYPLWRPRREYLDGLADYRRSRPFYTHFFFDWILGERRMSAGWQLPLAPPPEGGAFPVVVFSHGISGHRTCYTTYCSSLASYGFVVAAVEHRDRSASWSFYFKRSEEEGAKGLRWEECPVHITTFPEGEKEFEARNHQLHIRVRECTKMLRVFELLNNGGIVASDDDKENNGGGHGERLVYGKEFDWTQFKGRLNVEKAAVVGHSMGGASAIASTALSDAFKANVILDGWFYPIENGLYAKCSNRPTLMLNASTWQWAANVRRMLKLDADGRTERILLTMKDIVHQSFSDFAFLMPGYVGRKFRVQGELDPCYTGEAILEMSVAFLQKAFAGVSARDTLMQLAERYKEFVMEGTDLDLTTAEENSNDESPPRVVSKDAESSGKVSNM